MKQFPVFRMSFLATGFVQARSLLSAPPISSQNTVRKTQGTNAAMTGERK